MNKNIIRSEGEELIEEYLSEEGIIFIPEKKIENLKGDTFPYRKADFYLPRSATPGAWCMHTIKNNVFIKIKIQYAFLFKPI